MAKEKYLNLDGLKSFKEDLDNNLVLETSVFNDILNFSVLTTTEASSYIFEDTTNYNIVTVVFPQIDITDEKLYMVRLKLLIDGSEEEVFQKVKLSDFIVKSDGIYCSIDATKTGVGSYLSSDTSKISDFTSNNITGVLLTCKLLEKTDNTNFIVNGVNNDINSKEFVTVNGNDNQINGDYSLVSGNDNKINADNGVALGVGNIVGTEGGIASGTYCVENEEALLSVGNGTEDTSRSNALTLLKTGELDITGGLKYNGSIFEGSNTVNEEFINRSLILGEINTANKTDCSLILGSENESGIDKKVTCDVVYGYRNKLNQGSWYSSIGGYNNTINGEITASIVQGISNTVVDNSDSITLLGQRNTVSKSDCSFTNGKGNTNSSSNAGFVSGLGNFLFNTQQTVCFGYNNKIYGGQLVQNIPISVAGTENADTLLQFTISNATYPNFTETNYPAGEFIGIHDFYGCNLVEIKSSKTENGNTTFVIYAPGQWGNMVNFIGIIFPTKTYASLSQEVQQGGVFGQANGLGGSGYNSFILGFGCGASDSYQFATGHHAQAAAEGAAAMGWGTINKTEYGLAIGRFNEPATNQLFAIGNGTNKFNRETVMYVDETGNLFTKGKISLLGKTFSFDEDGNLLIEGEQVYKQKATSKYKPTYVGEIGEIVYREEQIPLMNVGWVYTGAYGWKSFGKVEFNNSVITDATNNDRELYDWEHVINPDNDEDFTYGFYWYDINTDTELTKADGSVLVSKLSEVNGYKETLLNDDITEDTNVFVLGNIPENNNSAAIRNYDIIWDLISSSNSLAENDFKITLEMDLAILSPTKDTNRPLESYDTFELVFYDGSTTGMPYIGVWDDRNKGRMKCSGNEDKNGVTHEFLYRTLGYLPIDTFVTLRVEVDGFNKISTYIDDCLIDDNLNNPLWNNIIHDDANRCGFELRFGDFDYVVCKEIRVKNNNPTKIRETVETDDETT